MTGPLAILVMGVSGSGKSTLGALLARRLDAPFLEGDDLHPWANRDKMAGGIPLSDDDRAPWLAEVGRALGGAARESGIAVATCSALKRDYRRMLVEAAGLTPALVHVRAEPSVLRARMRQRGGHFFPADLLDSQLADLEPPGLDESPFRLTADRSPDALAADVLGWLGERGWPVATKRGRR